MGMWREADDTALPKPIICKGDHVTFLNAETSGVFLTELKCGINVSRGQVIGQIVDPLRGIVLSTVTSPVDGYLFTIRAYPIVYEGSLMARIYNS
jgi:predicted deacylase